KYRSTLPGNDVVELPSPNYSIETLVHIRAITPVTTNRQIPNIREGEAVPDVSVRAGTLKLRSERIIGTTIPRTRTVCANGARSVVNRMRPCIRRKHRQPLRKPFLELALQRVVVGVSCVPRGSDRIDVVDIHQHYFTTTWTTLIVSRAGADILEHQQVAAYRTNVS